MRWCCFLKSLCGHHVSDACCRALVATPQGLKLLCILLLFLWVARVDGHWALGSWTGLGCGRRCKARSYDILEAAQDLGGLTQGGSPHAWGTDGESGFAQAFKPRMHSTSTNALKSSPSICPHAAPHATSASVHKLHHLLEQPRILGTIGELPHYTQGGLAECCTDLQQGGAGAPVSTCGSGHLQPRWHMAGETMWGSHLFQLVGRYGPSKVLVDVIKHTWSTQTTSPAETHTSTGGKAGSHPPGMPSRMP